MNAITLFSLKKSLASAGATALTALVVAGSVVQPAAADANASFDMVRSPSLAAFPNCLPNARVHVTIVPGGIDSVSR
jgi:hypothetical protein